MVQNALECVIIPPKIKMRRSTYELADGGHVPGVPAGPICVFSDPVQPLCGGDGAGGCDGAGSLVPGERNELLSGDAVRCGPSGQRRAELRRRIRGDQVVEYDRCPSSHTVALPDGTYCYCSLEVDRPFREFLPYAAAEQERVKAAPTLEDGEDGESLFFVSCVPWLSYTALTQPTPTPADSNPASPGAAGTDRRAGLCCL